MKYFPIFMDLENKPVLVVGGGEQAAQKVRLLLKTKADISVISESVNPEINALALDGRLRVSDRNVETTDIVGNVLVYAASSCKQLNRQVSNFAREEGIPVNVVDDPEYCSFITPAIVDRDPVTVAIGTEGAAPVLAREIKARIEAWLPTNYGKLAQIAQSLRAKVADSISDGRHRRLFWEQLFSGEFRNQVFSNNLKSGFKTFADLIQSYTTFSEEHSVSKLGSVSLVGCGPGDPDLLTLKAHQKLQSADVLVIDNLVSPEIVEYARRDARRIEVGKKPGQPSPSQEDINRILVEEAKAGNRVVRLKGGDPLIFGRAAEELTALHSNNIPVDIVPGISAANGCAAAIGLPLTVRQQHRQFAVLTGTSTEGLPGHDWQSLAREGQSLAIYMGVRKAGEIRKKLLEASMDPDTSVVIVENGTKSGQKVISTNLRFFEESLRSNRIHGPAIIFVGLDWMEAGLETPDFVLQEKFANVIPFETEDLRKLQELPMQAAR